MPKYKIVGNHRVQGAEPGETIDIDDDDLAAFLIAAGHVAPTGRKAKSKKADAPVEGDEPESENQ